MNDNDLLFMHRAIAEAGRSVDEDEQARPKVGVVFAKDGVLLASAHRGKYEPGEHAEFSALWHDLSSVDLRGTTAYTTLEPCTSRGHPKMPCAEWLVTRGVSRVVIGMLDPDPRICGKGYWLCRQYGVTVELFPPDLMLQIERINKTFIETKLQLTAPDKILIASDQPHIEAENALVQDYQSTSGFEELFYGAGVMRPNLCITKLSSGTRESVRNYIEQRGAAGLDRINRDLLLIKAKDEEGEPYLLHYHSGKAKSGWNTWLVPSLMRRGTNVVERLRNHAIELEVFLRIPAGSAQVTYAPEIPMTVSVKTNRFATEKALRLVPRLYVFRYCFVTVQNAGERLFLRENGVVVDGYMRRFRWIHPESFEEDDAMWQANADVILSLQHLYGTLMPSVPLSSSDSTVRMGNDGLIAPAPEDGQRKTES